MDKLAAELTFRQLKLHVFILIQILIFHQTKSLDLSSCRASLGMQTGIIPDQSISASSSLDQLNLGPTSARIRNDELGGAWCPKYQISKDSHEYLQIDFGRLKVITLVETQGRFGHGQGQEFAEQYVLYYQREAEGPWFKFKNRRGQEFFQGNANTYIAELREVSPPIIARTIRISPYSSHPKSVCLRVELYGCDWNDGVLSYSMKQGQARNSEINFIDLTYDGITSGSYLAGGLGQLIDGEEGQSNYRLDQHGLGVRGYDWVGWKRQDNEGGVGETVEIVFKFEAVRNFSSVRVHCNNQFNKDVRVFRAAEVWFSIDGLSFTPPPVLFHYERDSVIEYARDVTIPLERRIGQFVKLTLYFGSQWMLLSEIEFSSDYADMSFLTTTVLVETTESSTTTTTTTTAQVKEIIFHSPRSLVPTVKNSDFVQKNILSTTSAVLTLDNFPLEGNYLSLTIGVLSAITSVLFLVILVVIIRQRKYTCMPMQQYPLPKAGKTNVVIISGENKNGLPGSTVQDSDLEILHDYEYPSNYHVSPSRLSHTLLKTSLRPNGSPSRSLCLTSEAQRSDYGTTDRRELIPVYGQNEDILMESGSSMRMDEEMGDVVPLQLTPGNLRLVEQLGQSPFGQVQLCELCYYGDASKKSVTLNQPKHKPTLVVTKWLRSDATDQERLDFCQEIQTLLDLGQMQNLSAVVGLCMNQTPMCVCTEYTQHGDLKQFLRQHVGEGQATKHDKRKILSYGSLLYMATQIANGMSHMESMGLTHKDLSARNCLVGPFHSVKISDLGSGRSSRYKMDYCSVEPYAGLPVRWMSWESLLMGKYSSASDVWAFGVTVWEIVTFARVQPLNTLSDEQVINNLNFVCQNLNSFLIPSQPDSCQKEIYDLLKECWNREETRRPAFNEIHMFLQRKNMGYSPANDKISTRKHS